MTQPHPLIQVATSPEVAAALVSLAVVTIGVLRVYLSRLEERLRAQLARVQATAEEGTQASLIAKEQTTNSHGTNLRDDIDELKDANRRLEEQFTRVIERLDQSAAALEHRDRRAEDQIDGLRNDLRLLTASADRDHQVIHQRIDDIKTRCATCPPTPPPRG